MPKKWRRDVKLLTEGPIQILEMKKTRMKAALSRETPEMRRLRVLRLQRQVENGTYRPNLQVVAQRLVAEMHIGSSWH
jgi:hypothetical protein